MFYGAMVWDPWLILAQIVCIQCLYYISLGILLYAFVGTQVPRFTLKYFFDYTLVTATSIVGWSTLAAFFVNALAGAGYVFLLVERAKKCLDFTITMYIIHLVFCILYNGLPSSFLWWLVYIVCVVVTSLLAEWLCIRRELKDIPVRSTRLGELSYPVPPGPPHGSFLHSNHHIYASISSFSCLNLHSLPLH
ncbi:unnamed protein product [Sphagnum troendelagicum]|uniref:Protein SYS1 homolog n=1 Tax=Sphagnum troendelagicum TaxID=128251 RepID=A0ABP0U2R7_9BRYO